MSGAGNETIDLETIDLETIDLEITGMTCASCAHRIERKLSKLEGVSARVNLATNSARVAYPASLAPGALIDAISAAGYGASLPEPDAPAAPQVHGAHGPLTVRLIIAAALTIPVVILAMWPGLLVPGNAWWQAALATPVALWAAWPFHRAAARAARHRGATMDTLVSIGVLTAWGWSMVTLLGATEATGRPGMAHGSSAHYWFETAAVITTFLLLGRWLEERARARGQASLSALLTLGAKEVAILRDGREVLSPIAQLRVGDHFVVRPGEKVATDATVISGSSALDTALVTGEPIPVEVGPGSHVVGGTLNTTGALTLEATMVGDDTLLAQITRLVTGAQTGTSSAQRLADKISAVFVPAVLLLALATFATWWAVSGNWPRALGIAMAVLVVACPCALGLATPTALVAGVGRGASRGILIKSPQTLEGAGRLTHLVLDKTGTLTQGSPEFVAAHSLTPDLDQERALTLAAAIEQGSEHPLGRAIVAQAQQRGLTLPNASEFEARAGSGVSALIAGQRMEMGKAEQFTAFEEPGSASAAVTSVYLGWAGVARARFDLADPIRAEAAATIAELREQGITPVMATGDAEQVAQAIAQTVGIEQVHARLGPTDKYELVEALRSAGHVVGMVGDGINDAAALAAADVGIAMGAGADVAMEAGDIVLVRGQLADLPAALTLSQATQRVIRQNLGWAFGYNLVAIPLAMSGMINPMIAGAAMAASSVIVVSNSLRLRWA